MRIGFFKRASSYLLDAVPIIMLVTASLSWFVGDIIGNSIEDYDRLRVLYTENLAVYNETMSEYTQQYEDDIITAEEYTLLQTETQNTFTHNNSYLIDVVVYQYSLTALAYILIAFVVIYTGYMIALKGNSLGRRLTRIELAGNVTWYNIILRELFWKHLFWYGTLSAGMAIDLGLIAFTKKKATLRDTFSHTYLTPKGVNYPF